MASKLLVNEMDGTPKQIVFRKPTTFSPSSSVDLRKTTDSSQELYVDIDLTSLAGNAARQSNKVDLGQKRAPQYRCRAAFELAATPVAGQTVELWWAPSHTATAGNGNPGGVSGVDGAYTGYSSNLDASIVQLEYIGAFTVTAQATTTVQVGVVEGMFTPTERYGSLVVYNKSGAAFHSTADKIHIVLDPIVVEAQ